MPKITRKTIYNIDSEQIGNAYTDTMFDMAENLQDSIVLQITEDFIYKILKNEDYQVTEKTPNHVSTLKEYYFDKFNNAFGESIHLGLLKCLVPTVDWDCYVDDTENTEGEI